MKNPNETLKLAKRQCENILNSIEKRDIDGFSYALREFSEFSEHISSNEKLFSSRVFKHDLKDFIFHCEMFEEMTFKNEIAKQKWEKNLNSKLGSLFQV